MIRWAVSRPAVIWASVLIVLVAGAVSFSRLALATKTTVELPQLSVFASWGGASAELMEMYVTAPMEGAVQGIRGVRRTSSESGEGSASVTLKLDPKADVQMTRLAILERLEMAVSDSAFPPNVRPSVSNYVPDELRDQPLLRFTVIGQYSPPTLQRIINEQVVTRISAIPGVGNVSLSGSVRSGASVVYDPLLLRQLNIEPTVLGTALSSARQVRVLGDEELGASVRHVVLRDEPKALEDLEDLPIRAGNGLRSRTFRLSELSTITPSMEDGGNFIRIDGDPAMPLSISREAGADAIKTASAVLATLEEIRPSLPASVRLKITNDDSKQLREKLRDLVKRGLVAFGAVLVVMLLVLRNLRGTLLVMGSAAVAIAGTAFGLYVFKIPANLLTLAGLGMGIGILVQNGLIVLDGLGRAPDTIDGRARAGTTIFPAVLGATLTTVVVLFPFLYLQGDARAAFMPFAAAFALALGWSVIASVLMIPSVGTGHGMHVRRWRRLQHAYAWSMRGLLRWRWATVLITIVAISGLSWVFYKRVPRYSWGGGFGGNPTYISVNVTFPRGSDPETPANTIKEFEQMALRRPGVQQVYVSGSSRSANMRIDFTPEAEQTSIPVEMLDAMTQRAVMVGGASIGVHGIGPGFSSGGGGGGYGGSFRVKILGYSYRGVGAIAEDLKDRLEVIPRVRDVRITSASFYGSDRSFMATLQPDRQALARFGLSTQQFAAAVGREIRGSIGGGTSVSIAGEEIQVSLKSKGTRDRTLEELRQVIIPGAIGRTAVRIGDVALVGEREALSSVSREDQQYVRILTYDFRGPGKLAQRTHKAFMASTTVPLGYVVSDERFSFERDDSAKGLWLVFGIGVTLVVLAVAIVFDSVWAAAMVFLSLPIALAGVAAAFWLAKAAFTREAAVGVVLVVGLAVNQVILVVDAALAHRRRNAARFGRPFIRVSDAFRAALERSGTIMLVTLTTLASLIPLAYHTKVTDLFGSIALATAGGTVAGTIGAMFIMPPIMALTLHRRPRRTPAVAPLPVVVPAVPS
jgi:HAE1 family hydrophobic/amphiphilic exporter-1